MGFSTLLHVSFLFFIGTKVHLTTRLNYWLNIGPLTDIFLNKRHTLICTGKFYVVSHQCVFAFRACNSIMFIIWVLELALTLVTAILIKTLALRKIKNSLALVLALETEDINIKLKFNRVINFEN